MKRQSNNSSVFIYLYEFEYIGRCILHTCAYTLTCSIRVNIFSLLVTSKHEIIIIRYKHCNRRKSGMLKETAKILMFSS